MGKSLFKTFIYPEKHCSFREVKPLAVYLGLPVTTVREWIQSGKIRMTPAGLIGTRQVCNYVALQLNMTREQLEAKYKKSNTNAKPNLQFAVVDKTELDNPDLDPFAVFKQEPSQEDNTMGEDKGEDEVFLSSDKNRPPLELDSRLGDLWLLTEEDVKRLPPAERLRYWKAVVEETKAKQLKGELILKTEVEQQQVDQVNQLKSSLLTLPRRLAGVLASTLKPAEAESILTREIERLIAEFAGQEYGLDS